MKLNFVCLGNICRSPLAHTIMEKKLKKRDLGNRFTVDSSGLGSWHIGNPSDSRMRAIASSHGYTITHRAQQFRQQDGVDSDYIFAMDRSIYNGILELIKEDYRNKVIMFRKYDLYEPSGDVLDPYYGGSDGFEKVFQMVEDNCERIIDNLLLKEF